MNIDEAAGLLLVAETGASDRAPLTDQWPDLDLATAYEIQDETLRRRLARGERLVGVKLGLTSVAKQRTMGIDRPLVAWLTDAMAIAPGVAVGPGLIHPRVEPEIVLVLGERLAGPGVTAPEALSAVASVHCGMEVIDSRFTDFRFTLPDVVADNASSAAYVVGPIALAPYGLDLSIEACVLSVDGAVIDTATGSAVQGHPAQALAFAANTLAARGLALEPGWTVLTGGMTDAVAISAGTTVVAEFTHLGRVVLRGEEGIARS